MLRARRASVMGIRRVCMLGACMLGAAGKACVFGAEQLPPTQAASNRNQTVPHQNNKLLHLLARFEKYFPRCVFCFIANDDIHKPHGREVSEKNESKQKVNTDK